MPTTFTDNKSTIVLDTRGMACPLPILKLKKKLENLQKGTKVRLLATDRGLIEDLRQFCKYQKADFSAISEDGELEYLVWMPE